MGWLMTSWYIGKFLGTGTTTTVAAAAARKLTGAIDEAY
jgi:hypothetical protein